MSVKFAKRDVTMGTHAKIAGRIAISVFGLGILGIRLRPRQLTYINQIYQSYSRVSTSHLPRQSRRLQINRLQHMAMR
jgi:hypothetical protein